MDFCLGWGLPTFLKRLPLGLGLKPSGNPHPIGASLWLNFRFLNLRFENSTKDSS